MSNNEQRPHMPSAKQGRQHHGGAARPKDFDATVRAHLRSVPAGDDFARLEAAMERRDKRQFWTIAGLAGVTALTLLGVLSNELSDRQAPPTTTAVAPPVTGDLSPEPETLRPFPVQPGDSVWAYAANRTPRGGDPAPLAAVIEQQLDDDGTPGLQAFDPSNGTGDVLELPPALPPTQDANPNNDRDIVQPRG